MAMDIRPQTECPVQNPNPVVATTTHVHFKSALLADGWANDVRVAIADGVFASISRDTPPEPDDERAAIGLPGLTNVHSHAFQRGMAGLTEHRGRNVDDFWTWRELMYRFVRNITPEDAEALATQAYVEMLEAGFTRVGEFHYLHHDPSGRSYADLAEMAARIAAAADRSGIALTLLPVFYAHGGFGGQPPHSGQQRFVTDLDQFARLVESSRRLLASLPHATLGIAPHSLRAVTPDELAAVQSLAGVGPIHIHAAEQLREVEECVAWSGARPIEWLLSNAPIDQRWCIVHATHMNDNEVLALAASRAAAGLCPITEANLGDGVFRAAEYLRAGGMFGIGTDSNVLINAAQELQQLEYSQRLHHRKRNVLARGPNQSVGRTLFEGALKGGAQALGVAAGIEVGAPADMFSLALDDVAFASRTGDQILDTFVFAGGDKCVDRVWRAGVCVVTGGRHREREAIDARYRAVLERLLRI
jgi:formimidoylglutamate deiminase